MRLNKINLKDFFIRKKPIILAGILSGVVVFSFYWYWTINGKNNQTFPSITEEESNSTKQHFSILSAEGVLPRFVEAEIEPLKVKVGEIQKMRVVIQDDVAMERVVAEIETDNGKREIDLKEISQKTVSKTESKSARYYLREGRLRIAGEEFDLSELGTILKNQFKFLLPVSGQPVGAQEKPMLEFTYYGEWRVEDTTSKTYHTTFRAKDIEGRKNQITLAWSDPCSPPPGGNWTLDANCSISGVNGVDDGNYYNQTYTLTIQNGATFAFNPGKVFVIQSGSVAIADGGQIKKTYLWYRDSDGDGYVVTSAEQLAADTRPTGTVRRSSALSAVDCYEGNSNAYPGSTYCGTTDRGDGSFDYDCSGSNTICNGPYYDARSDCVAVWSNYLKRCNRCAFYHTHVNLSSPKSCGQSGYLQGASHQEAYGDCGNLVTFYYAGSSGIQGCR